MIRVKNKTRPGNGSRLNGSLTRNVLVLNKHYIVVHVCTMKRAVDLLYNENAEVLFVDRDMYNSFRFEEWIQVSQDPDVYFDDPESPAEQDWIRTVSMRFLAPRVIRLLSYDRIPKWEVKLNRKNILLRDKFTCQYCYTKFQTSKLSIDHVMPRSRGGKTVWANVATACVRCNTRKGNRLPNEAGMKLERKPRKPAFNHIFHSHLNSPRYAQWKKFLPKTSPSKAS